MEIHEFWKLAWGESYPARDGRTFTPYSGVAVLTSGTWRALYVITPSEEDEPFLCEHKHRSRSAAERCLWKEPEWH